MTRRIALLIVLAAAAAVSGCAAVVVGGAATGVAVANDRRLADVMASDERIEWQAQDLISSRLKDKVHVNATSYNRTVLLTGEATTEAEKAEATRLAAGIQEVRNVVNEMVIAQPSTMANRSNDTYITSQVKARMVSAQKFNPLHVKVVTERSVVYLMGLVTQKEADDATQIARTTSDVRRVVRAFEIIPDSKGSAPPAQQPPQTGPRP